MVDIRALQMLPETQPYPEAAICRYDESAGPTAGNTCAPYASNTCGGFTAT